ncbi:glycosyltransferase [Reyranella sp.]|uniref:glycosyltransferase family 4 protein n=1 Tax=Reyranella sp. TaxID=1929291 RepID=UPI001225501C|nr:glycosyltransferase [Reyranella sp.]TAJ82783.1 MAG: glycosyltransferase family 1 protein [Reyranella sp.]
MRALIIDPALHSMGGHHYNATLALKAKLSALGIEHDCLGSANADAQTVRELGCAPCFTKSVYGRAYEEPEEFEQHVQTRVKELSVALKQRPKFDLFILPCCDQILAFALARYFRFRPAPHLLLWALYAPHHNKSIDDPTATHLRRETREAFAALQRIVGLERISAFCETPQMADIYRDLAGFDFGVAPGPGLISGKRVHHQDGAPIVSCIGFANEAKGYRLLPEALREVIDRDHEVRFMIHGFFQGSDARDQAPVFAALAELGPRVTVSTEVLSQSDYLAWLGQADLVLLPYDPKVYETRGSGVFFEARRLGIPVIATKGCGFAQPAFEAGWGVEIPRHDASSVAAAVLQALQKIDDLTSHARTASTSHDDVDDILKTAITRILSGRGRRGRAGQ